MSDFILFKTLHYIGIFSVVSGVFFQAVSIKPFMTRKELVVMSKVDALYGMGALLTVGAGLAMWFWVGKPAAFYSGNWIFIVKIIVFSLVGILSIWPTVFYIKNRENASEESVAIPDLLRYSVYAEIVFLFVMPVMAVLMANGIGGY